MNRLWLSLCLIQLFLLQVHPIVSSSISDLFDSWCQEHGKTYVSEEEREHRLGVFSENYDFIASHNARANYSYTLSLNAFADLTRSEFGGRYLGFSPSGHDLLIRKNRGSGSYRSRNYSAVPSSIDWRKKGAVTGIKDQGSCGACWSFSATGAIEGINQIVTGSLVSLSEQELIDCDHSYNQGCNGGLMDYAYEFILKNKGIDTEEDYSYKGRDASCSQNKLNKRVVTIDSYVDIPEKNEQMLLEAVASQPVSVGISGGDAPFQFYSQGIFTGPCSTSLDHAVLIVGYDSKNGKDYWIVKNSWGKSWGMDGYMYVQRNTGNQNGICEINMMASYPVKTNPNPSPSPSPPGPTKCSLFSYCSQGETCCCARRFLGLCMRYKCCGAESAVCCEDNVHCCPQDYPICDTAQSVCRKMSGNSTMAIPVG
ncbi:hypothetical protein M569_14597, partial [Genlisea aurea]